MDLERTHLDRVNVKLYVEDTGGATLADFVPVFHRWIRDAVLDDMLVDVHDYSHVYQGAGILLVAFESNYSMDETAGALGLLYGRKQPLPGTDEERLTAALRAALGAARTLEAEDGLSLRFATNRLRVIVNDRLAAPNAEASVEALRPTFDRVLSRLFDGAPYAMSREADPRKRLELEVTAPGPAADLDTLFARLA